MSRPFEKLTRSTQRKRLRSLAFESLEGCGVIAREIRLLQFEDNAVYLVEADGGRYVLRMSVRDGRSPQEQESELGWMDALVSDKAIIAPKPVHAGPDRKVLSQTPSGWPETVTSAVFEWIPGKASPGSLNAEMAEELGRVTAKLHEHAVRYEMPAGFSRPAWGHAQIFEDGAAVSDPLAVERLDVGEQDLLVQVGEAVRDRLPEHVSAEWGLIHADLHRGNLVVTPDNNLAVIDFDDCGLGYYMLDVATVLSSFLRSVGPAKYPNFAEKYVCGYLSVREFPASIDRLNEFLVMRDMIILNFILGSRNKAVMEWGPSRAQGILDLMREYLNTGKYPGWLNLT
ncbi:phosphotransferase [Streptomyces sp. SID8352]|uniref:phosphotransferase enzyme family protein n=1 Tax=Streptomyces sp. SID8352 TaxID=2690338 RepID=UPI00136B34B1|nr:phosphotransferase [Streptomyces sp. SID8352]MYU23637.1 phosphotransferase [Streptomyces sp. SID8352]